MHSVTSKFWLLMLLFGVCASQEIDFKQVEKLPPGVPTCRQKDTNLNVCLKSIFEQMLPRIKNGMPELNIPPLDPLVLQRTAYEYSTGLIQGRVSLRNGTVRGIAELKLRSIDVKIKENKVKAKIIAFVPKIFVEGNFRGNLKINELKITPKGHVNLTLTDVEMTILPEAEIYERDGHRYLKLLKINVVPEVGDMKLYATGLVPDPALNDVILELANDNWRQIYRTILPETRTTWEPQILDFSNKFFAVLPLDLIVEDI